MSNVALSAIAWIALILHVAVGVAARRQVTELPLVPILNLLVALGVIAYWVQQWYGYIANGIIWYATDQIVPLYALLVCLLSGLAIAGRYSGSLPHWIVFGIDTAVLLGAALLFTVVRFNRLM
jgi:hypothetical protein